MGGITDSLRTVGYVTSSLAKGWPGIAGKSFRGGGQHLPLWRKVGGRDTF